MAELSLVSNVHLHSLADQLICLGDKENHIASIHLPQMLYIWPYIAFFSFPGLLPFLTTALLSWLPPKIVDLLPQALRPSGFNPVQRLRITIICICILLALALLIIHYNTIVHPFTLAENRHYTVYIFRLLMRHPWTKYLGTPLYLFFSWACIGAIGQSGSTSQGGEEAGRKRGTKVGSPRSRLDGASQVSFVLLWLLTSTLSLASTPLVEPRYFILPWIFWRVNVRLDHATPNGRAILKAKSEEGLLIAFLRTSALYMETLWLVLINVVTGYLFLHRGFTWPNEPGAIQRFMW